MSLVAPRAEIKLFVSHCGTFNNSFGRRCSALSLDRCLCGLVNEVPERLGELVDSVTHWSPFPRSRWLVEGTHQLLVNLIEVDADYATGASHTLTRQLSVGPSADRQ
jgi:hypothetical protein